MLNGWRPSVSLYRRRPAEFLQAFAAFAPGGGVENADVVIFEASNHLRSLRGAA